MEPWVAHSGTSHCIWTVRVTSTVALDLVATQTVGLWKRTFCLASLKHCSCEAGLARPECPPFCCCRCHPRRRPCPFVCSCVHHTHAPGSCCSLRFLTKCFLCKPPILPVREVAVSVTKRHASPGPEPCCAHIHRPLTSHFPSSYLSLSAEETLTLRGGAFEGVSVPFLPPAACGRCHSCIWIDRTVNQALRSVVMSV